MGTYLGTHQLPLEQATETANAVGPWISKSIRTWEENEIRVAEGWARQPLDERLKGMSGWIPGLQKRFEALIEHSCCSYIMT
ncbi:hypothetical protein N7528_009881 [Penicillium herquei]|nr:hypothetical protein N7528_009881 [Penicillium herquei]